MTRRAPRRKASTGRAPRGKPAQRRASDRLGAGLLLLLAMIVIGGLAGAALLRPRPLDPDTDCALLQPPAAHTLVLIDASDALAARHRKRLLAALRGERLGLGPGDRMTIAALRPQAPREPAILASRCHPGDGRSVNPLFTDPEAAQARYDETFAAAMDAAAALAGRAPDDSEATPLLDTIASLAADPTFAADVRRRRLVIISDFLEHRGGLSFYGDDPPLYQSWAATPDAAGRIPALDNVTVRLLPIDREGRAARQRAALDQFWAPYFTDRGAEATIDP